MIVVSSLNNVFDPSNYTSAKYAFVGAARKKAIDSSSRGDDATLSPTRKTRMSPRRAQGNSPMSHNYCKTRRSKPTEENLESNNASDDSHNETKV